MLEFADMADRQLYLGNQIKIFLHASKKKYALFQEKYVQCKFYIFLIATTQ
jgi:hypothetical protein